MSIHPIKRKPPLLLLTLLILVVVTLQLNGQNIQFKDNDPECAKVKSHIEVPAPIPINPEVPIWLPIETPNTTKLTQIDLATSSRGWAVGFGGTILGMRKGVWSEEASPIDEDLISIDAISDNEAYAVSKTGKVIAYDGSRWTLLCSEPLPADLNAVQFISKTNGWAAYVDRHRSTITRFNGESWKTEYASKGDYPTVVDFGMISPNKGWAVGSNLAEDPKGHSYVRRGHSMVRVSDTGVLIHYKNGNWTYKNVEIGLLHAIDVNTRGIGWAISKDTDVGRRRINRIIRFDGDSLQIVSENANWNLYDVITFEDGSGVAVGKPMLLLNRDSIKEWPYSNNREFQSLSYLDENEAWAISSIGDLFHYTEPGVIEPPNAPLLSKIDNPNGEYRFALTWSVVDNATAYVLVGHLS